ncbi:MAG: amino acid ABC transporter permease [Clostridiales bacterium]|nr:amino acid ABC transporter permease [Clostridiales bacterium]
MFAAYDPDRLSFLPEWLREWLEDLVATFVLNFVDGDRYMYIVKGLWMTIRVTFFACLLGIALGIVCAIIRSTYDKCIMNMNKGFARHILRFFNTITNLYLTVIRGTPVVVQLMIAYFVIFASSKNKIMVAVLAFGINSGAYVAEIIRSGIMSIDNGQFEAGRSLGFNYVQTMAYIIIPQAFKNVLPALANEFIVLLKETSVSGYIGLEDLTKGGDIIRSRTYSAFMPLLAVALIYLVIVIFFSKLVSLLERRLRNSER